MFMRKLAAGILAVGMAFALAACGGSSSGSSSGGSSGGSDASQLDWPKKNITVICPYSAGGGTDLMSRAVAEKLAERFGVSVLVEDQPGGSGSVGMQLCASAKNDGYTIILTACGAATLSPWLNDVSYTDESFAPIAQVSASPSVLCVSKASGITSFEELYEKAKAAPGTITVGSSGAGSSHHIGIAALGLGLENDANLFQHIAYGGGAEAVTNLLGGHVDATATIYSEVAAYIESGDFIPLLVVGPETPESFGDIPNAKDLLGVDCDGGTWYAFAAPAGTDQAIIDLYESEILDIMAQPEMVETFENLGNPVVLLNAEELSEKWSAAYKAAETTLKAIGMLQ